MTKLEFDRTLILIGKQLKRLYAAQGCGDEPELHVAFVELPAHAPRIAVYEKTWQPAQLDKLCQASCDGGAPFSIPKKLEGYLGVAVWPLLSLTNLEMSGGGPSVAATVVAFRLAADFGSPNSADRRGSAGDTGIIRQRTLAQAGVFVAGPWSGALREEFKFQCEPGRVTIKPVPSAVAGLRSILAWENQMRRRVERVALKTGGVVESALVRDWLRREDDTVMFGCSVGDRSGLTGAPLSLWGSGTVLGLEEDDEDEAH